MSKELDYLDDILKNEPMTLNKRMIIECIKEKLQRLESIDNAKPSEALKELENIKNFEGSYGTLYDSHCEELDTIKQALLKAQEQEKENADYGSARERWKIVCQMIKRMFGFDIEEKWSGDDKVITQTLIKAQDMEKVLSIIKEKDVDIVELKSAKTVEDYNLQFCGGVSEPLTEEEFELLKKYFREDKSE